MSVCRPARCLIRASESSIPRLRPSASRTPTRTFHQTSVRPSRRRRPHYQSLKIDELRKLEQDAANAFPRFTDQQWEAMKSHYTPEQIEVLKLAEEAIDPKDLHEQISLRNDPWRVRYSEDFAKIDPLLDKQPKAEVTGEQPRFEFYEEQSEWEEAFARRISDVIFGTADPRSTEEIIQDVLKAPEADDRAKLLATRIRQFIGTDKEQVGRDILEQLNAKLGLAMLVPDFGGDFGGNIMDSRKYLRGIGLDAQKDDFMLLKSGDKELLERTLHDPAYSVLNPPIPKFDDPRVRYPSAEESDPMASSLRRLSLITGRTIQDLKRFKSKNLVINRVVNQTRMGKIPSFYTLSIAGDGNGLLGIGEGKSAELGDSIRQSHIKSIRNLTPVLRYEARTIYGEVWGKVGATEVELSSRPPGFGVRCQHLVFEMCRLAGIRDLSARVTRARNPMNTVKATFQALTKQKLPEDIARARGRKLVDVRKVYYAGNVL